MGGAKRTAAAAKVGGFGGWNGAESGERPVLLLGVCEMRFAILAERKQPEVATTQGVPDL